MTLPTIISLTPDQWTTETMQPEEPKPRPRRSWLKAKLQKARALALALPLARLTTAALIFEVGKVAASLLAPELQPWSVAL